jgi:hypothetical protein
MNREFCCHHIRSQNGRKKKILLASFTNKKLRWNQSCIGIIFCRNKFQVQKFLLWPYLWKWINSINTSMSRKLTMPAFRERKVSCIHIIFLLILQLKGLVPMAYSISYTICERENLVDTDRKLRTASGCPSQGSDHTHWLSMKIFRGRIRWEEYLP